MLSLPPLNLRSTKNCFTVDYALVHALNSHDVSL